MEKNLCTYDLFLERFPVLGLQMGTWELKERPAEKLPDIFPGKEEVFYFLGLNLDVYKMRKEWLQGDKQLVFLEDDPGIIASFLQKKEAFEVLSNPNVHIELLGDIEALVNRFPVNRIEVSGLKSKMRRKKKLRLELFRKTALAHALHIDRLHGYQPFANFVQNVRQLPKSFYANRLMGAFKNVPAVVCGAGPSLEPTLEVIKEVDDRALIIAGGSTIAALSSKGIIPHFGMVVDPNLEEFRRLKNSFAFEMPLLYSTRVHPDIFKTCNGPFGYMRSGIGGIVEMWIDQKLSLQDFFIGELLPSETISVTGICIAFAQFLGCNPILLNGIDMAYTGGMQYASGVDREEPIDFDTIDREKSALNRIVRKKGVVTAVRWLMESASISQFSKMHKNTRFINTTIEGVGFKGIDYVPIEMAVREFKQQDKNLRDQVFEKICAAPMPESTKETIEIQFQELSASLKRVIHHLQVLSGAKKGSAALSELELEDEIARSYLFYDVKNILKPGPTFWQSWLELAQQYEKAISRRSNGSSYF